jgi:hypothetical protein
VRTLDDVIDQVVAGIREPRIYLKMDTQGYDQHVLAGAERSLASVVALQSEVAVQHLYDHVPNFETAVARFGDLGFAPVGFFPVEKEVDDMGVVEFDFVAVRH